MCLFIFLSSVCVLVVVRRTQCETSGSPGSLGDSRVMSSDELSENHVVSEPGGSGVSAFIPLE